MEGWEVEAKLINFNQLLEYDLFLFLIVFWVDFFVMGYDLLFLFSSLLIIKLIIGPWA